MPPIDERLALAERTMIALVADAELPPKIGVHPRTGRLVRPRHAGLPARARRRRRAATWSGSSGSPASRQRAIGLPAIHAVVVLNDPATGVPDAILDGGPDHRAADRRGVGRGDRAVRATGRRPAARRPRRRRHPGPQPPRGARPRCCRASDLRDLRPPRRARRSARRGGGGHARDRRGAVRADARSAVASADVVVTAASFGPVRQAMTADWLAPDALVVAVDYATIVRRRGRARRGAVRGRRPRPVPRQPRRRPVRRLPGSGATLGEAILAGRARDRPRPRRRHPPRRRPRRRRLRGRDPASERTTPARHHPAAGAGPGDRPVCPMSSWSGPGRWAPGRRSRRGGGLADDADRRVRGRPSAARPPATRPGSSGRRTATTRSTRAGRARPGRRGSRSARRSGEPLFVAGRGALVRPREDGFEAASEATLRELGIPVERLTPAELVDALAADRRRRPARSPSTSPRPGS